MSARLRKVSGENEGSSPTRSCPSEWCWGGGQAPAGTTALPLIAVNLRDCVAGSRDRGEADQARAVPLTLIGWTSPRIAEAFGVREDAVRLWRIDFVGGVAALQASVVPGRTPLKSEAALRVVPPLLAEPMADRRNWTIPWLSWHIVEQPCLRLKSKFHVRKISRRTGA